MKPLLSTLAFASLLLALPTAWAHGTAEHGKPKTAVVKEQKPWGIAADARQAQRTMEIRMTDDMRFTPDRIQVRQGETVRLVVANSGKVLHELVRGTPQELKAHADMMKKFPGMEHDEPYMAHVDAGKKSEIVWTFNRPGDFEFACLIAGHFEAGMVGKIKVVASAAATAKPAAPSAMSDPSTHKH